jgi:hypothetical protein
MNVELLILEKLYKDAAEKLIKTIERKSVRGGLAVYERSVLLEVSGILKKLNRDAEKWVNEFIPAEYLLSANETIDLLRQSRSSTKKPSTLSCVTLQASCSRPIKPLVEESKGC